ncbi:alpha/beta fold hydrolase [Falsirhodobacter xinxiangensis]|uniref:alpha/beta fold hydrolase n=1 Tax=Falsirhodobacter xinxiangensis TaxID=2530049 RepID=UPI0010AB4E28|nr:alpha/beta hydrolase [Rhodobacter xinxiangensis]
MKTSMVLPALVLAATNAFAATVPSQADWVDAKRFVTLPNGMQMAYVEMGNPEGNPVLMIHGYSDSSRTWSNVAPYLSDNRLLAIDLRSHGDSNTPECCHTLNDFANDASLFVSAMGLEKVDALGHSLVGMVSQAFAALHGDRVDNLVLLATSLGKGETGG